MHRELDIVYRIDPAVRNEELNALFAAAWPAHSWRDFRPILKQSLAFVCAYQAERLIGFVNLAWDGGFHAFLLDTTVHPDLQRRGIGRRLVGHAAEVARERGTVWLHVDCELRWTAFYRGCGFRHTEAGLMCLGPAEGAA